MDNNAILEFIQSNTVTAGTGTAALVFLYKIWRIVQSDRKEDEHGQTEKDLRDELRVDLKDIKEQLKNCETEKIQTQKEIFELTKKIATLSVEKSELEKQIAKINRCQYARTGECPL